MIQNVIRALPLILAAFLSVSLSVSASHSRSRVLHKSLGQRFAGLISDLNLPVFTGTRWTFYDAGLGACGATNKNEDYIVALNAIQFGMGYPGPQCFKQIIMEYNGKRATATIMDMCPECPYAALDLSRGLFDFFASEDEGVIYGQWYFADPRRGGDEDNRAPAPSTTQPKSKPSPTADANLIQDPNVPPVGDPVSKPPGPAQATPASEPTRSARPLNHSQRPASEMDTNLLPPLPARIPPANSDTGAAARPDDKKIVSTKLSSSDVASMLKDTPLKSDDTSEDEDEQSENLVGFDTIFDRMGSIAAAGSATNRNE